jgi:hypothetical protein
MSSVRSLWEHHEYGVLHVHPGQTERAPLAIARQEDSSLCHAEPIRFAQGDKLRAGWQGTSVMLSAAKHRDVRQGGPSLRSG